MLSEGRNSEVFLPTLISARWQRQWAGSIRSKPTTDRHAFPWKHTHAAWSVDVYRSQVRSHFHCTCNAHMGVGTGELGVLTPWKYAGGVSRFMSPMQRCFSDLVCQPLVTSYVIDAYLCLPVLHARTHEYQHNDAQLCVWWWIPTKAESQWLAGERRVALATSGSTRFRTMPTLLPLYMLWRSEIARGHGPAQRFTRTTRRRRRRRWWWWRMKDVCQKWRG